MVTPVDWENGCAGDLRLGGPWEAGKTKVFWCDKPWVVSSVWKRIEEAASSGAVLVEEPVVGEKLQQDTSYFFQTDKAGNFTVAD